MTIETLFPPNYEKIKMFLPVKEGTIFCYGDIIYNPQGVNILPDQIVHEEVHKKQQGNDVEGWYDRYLTDREFRLESEIEAYGCQLAFAMKHVHGKLLDWAKDSMATALSSDYDLRISYGEALSKIRNYKCKQTAP